MTKDELYLKTVFCCIACDGDIATEEVDMVRDLCAKDGIFHNLDSEECLNSWITEINEQGGVFLQTYGPRGIVRGGQMPLPNQRQ